MWLIIYYLITNLKYKFIYLLALKANCITNITKKMTKADIVKNISDQTGVDKTDVQMIVEKFMDQVRDSIQKNNNVYLRGFGSFVVKTRAEKTGRNISKNTAVIIPAHNIPSFKPSKTFVESVKKNVPVG